MSNPWIATVILVLVGAGAFGASLLARRLLGTRRVDREPWSTTLGYVGATYGFLVGFSIVLLFGQFADARQAVGDEATSIGTAFEQARLFPASTESIQEALYCYADAVVRDDWDAMRRGGSAPEVDAAYADLVASVAVGDEPAVGALHAATATNLASQIGAISTARETRLVAAENRVPTMLWAVLFGGGAVVVVLLFVVLTPARPGTQGLLVAVAAVFTLAMLLIVVAIASPYARGAGRVSPELIEQTAASMEQELPAIPTCSFDESP